MAAKTNPTINDIARLAGVSKTTVSFAFNNPARVAPKTLARILEIADSLSYTPDPIARTLTTKKVGSLGFLLPETTPEGFKNPLLFQLIQGIRMGCIQENLSLNVVSPPPGYLLDALKVTPVDGYIILGMINDDAVIRYLEKRDLPMVSLDGGVLKHIPQVISRDMDGARELMGYLLRQGHEKILILSFNDAVELSPEFSDSAGFRRLRGYRRALQDFGWDSDSPNVKVIECSECSAGGGYGAMEAARQIGFHATAVVAMSDIIAIGVYEYCLDRRIRIPEDISIVGFDDIREVKLLSPPLTTVFQPSVQKGTIAAEMLIRRMNGERNLENVILDTELKYRKSVQKR